MGLHNTEKVNLDGVFSNPWHKQDRMWSRILDGLRYMIVWHPIIVIIGQMALSMAGITLDEQTQVTHEFKLQHRYLLYH